MSDLRTAHIPHGALTNTMDHRIETARDGWWIAYPARFEDRSLLERYQHAAGSGATEAQALASAACVACATCRTCADPDALPPGVAQMPVPAVRGYSPGIALVRDGLQLGIIWSDRSRGINFCPTGGGYYRYYRTLAEAGIAAVRFAEWGWPTEYDEQGRVSERGVDRTRKPLTKRYATTKTATPKRSAR